MLIKQIFWFVASFVITAWNSKRSGVERREYQAFNANYPHKSPHRNFREIQGLNRVAKASLVKTGRIQNSEF